MYAIVTGLKYAPYALGLLLIGYILYKDRTKSREEMLYDKLTDIKPGLMKYYWVVWALILLFGILLRGFKLGEIPYGLNQDEAMTAVDAKALLDYGTDKLGNSFPAEFVAWGSSGQSVLLGYLIVPFIKLLGYNMLAVRMPLMLVSVAGMIVMWLWAKELFGERTALIAFAVTAISPWQVMQSRWALDCNMLAHFWLFGVFFLYKGLRKRWSLYLSMVFLGLSMYGYGIAFYTVPLFMLIFCIAAMRKRLIGWKELIPCSLIYFAVSGPIYAAMAINALKLPTLKLFGITMPLLETQNRSSDILFINFSWEQLLHNIKCLWNNVILQQDRSWCHVILWYGTIYLCSVPFVILGIRYLIKRIRSEQDKANKLCFQAIFWYAGVALLSGLITKDVNTGRINFLFYPVLLFTALGIYYTICSIKRSVWAVAAIYAVSVFCFAATYFTSYRKTYDWYKDINEALAATADEDCRYYYITGVRQDSGTAISQILTLFQHEVDSRYYQGAYEIDGAAYKDRYRYYSDISEVDTSKEDTVYIIYADEEQYFKLEDFEVSHFGSIEVLR